MARVTETMARVRVMTRIRPPMTRIRPSIIPPLPLLAAHLRYLVSGIKNSLQEARNLGDRMGRPLQEAFGGGPPAQSCLPASSPPSQSCLPASSPASLPGMPHISPSRTLLPRTHPCPAPLEPPRGRCGRVQGRSPPGPARLRGSRAGAIQQEPSRHGAMSAACRPQTNRHLPQALPAPEHPARPGPPAAQARFLCCLARLTDCAAHRSIAAHR
jgi:hypothetical protein